MRALTLVALLALAACGGNGGGVSAPSVVEPPKPSALAVPATLRAVWTPPDAALWRAAHYRANTVVLQIDSWGADHTTLAQMLRERGIGVMVYVEQVFTRPRAGWDAGWQQVQTWDKPFRDAGLLFGYHVMDEPAHRGNYGNGLRDDANAYVRGRGYDVLATEWIEYVTDAAGDRALRRPPGVRWYAVTCYDFGGRPKWHFQNCAEEYSRHPDWDTVVGQGFDAGNGLPDPALWENLAAKLNRGIIWWVDSE